MSEPDKNGIVTMFRPMVAHLAQGEPVEVVLHWAEADGPLGNRVKLESLEMIGMIESLKFELTTPGRKFVLRPRIEVLTTPVPGTKHAGSDFSRGWAYDLTSKPTFLLTLGRDGPKIRGFAGWQHFTEAAPRRRCS